MDLLLVLLPLVLLELGGRVITLLLIVKAKNREETFRFFDPIVWILIVAFVNFAWIFYYILGREEA
jgi:hypothetical protein